MLFIQILCEKIFTGLKTQTRRVVLPNQVAETDEHGTILRIYQDTPKGRRLKWEVGRTYAICPGRGKPAQGRIQLIGIRREFLQDITVEDIKAEGIIPQPIILNISTAYRGAWIHLWNTINQQRGYGWSTNPEVWVLCFQVMGQQS